MSDSLRVFGADLETDNDGSRAWVVQWAISDSYQEQTGRSLDSLKPALLDLMRRGECFLYFHNLKYDLEFIKYILRDLADENGFELNIMMREKNPIFVKLVPPKASKLKPLNIRDSMKKIPGNLADMAKTVGLEKLEGFDFVPGWSKSVDLEDQDNWKYIKMDARIVAVAMRKLHDMGNNRSTYSGDAWHHAKKLLGSDKDGKEYKENMRWERLFPVLDFDLDSKLRRGYFGGINISRHRGKCEGPITHADVNSMYPTVMYYDPLPHGKPTYTDRKPRDGDLYVVNAMFRFKLKPGMIPWYQFKDVLDNTMEGLKTGEPVVEAKLWHEMTFTSVDLDTLSRWYDVEMDPEFPPEYWIFKQKIGIFRPYIDQWQKAKREATKGSIEYNVAKRMQNSLYGRFGLNPQGQNTELVYQDGDLTWSKEATINEENDAYLPYAMFITAHARKRLLGYVAAVGPENVIHCDTDSVIHFGGLVPGIPYGKMLGEWGLEEAPLRMWEGGFKRYVEQVEEEISNDAYNMACAGVPQKSNHRKVPVGMWVEILDNPDKILSDDVLGNVSYSIKSAWLRELYIKAGMNPDSVNTMKLIPVKVPGGVILEERQHKLKDGLIYRLR